MEPETSKYLLPRTILNYIVRDAWMKDGKIQGMYSHARKPTQPGKWFICEIDTEGFISVVLGNKAYFKNAKIKAPKVENK